MQVIGQNHHGVAGGGKFLHCFGIGVAQAFDMVGQKAAALILQPDGEEIGRSGDDKALRLGHAASLALGRLRKD